jgi:hypothetical protein
MNNLLKSVLVEGIAAANVDERLPQLKQELLN